MYDDILEKAIITSFISQKKTSSKMPDTMFTEDEEDLKSLLSNIDESLNKSSEILVRHFRKSLYFLLNESFCKSLCFLRLFQF